MLFFFGSKHRKNLELLACLSRSMTSTRREYFHPRTQARLQAVTDFPTPPLRLIIAILLILRIVVSFLLICLSLFWLLRSDNPATGP